MDLIASATVDEQVNVHRLNGQRVFGISSKSGMGKISGLRWKPDGQILAVAYSNNVLYLISAHTGKVVHQLDCNSRSNSPICCLGWGFNVVTDPKTIHGKGGPGSEPTLDALLGHGIKHPSDNPPDLPRDLAFLDVEALLPRLSSLASDDDIFHSRTSLETVFQPSSKSYNDSADVLVVGFEDGTIHLSIYDFFEIGHFTLPSPSAESRSLRLLSDTSHPYTTTHPLLVTGLDKGVSELHLFPLDLRLVSSAGRYLSLLASKSTQLHNVLRYIQQVQKHMYSEFKSSQELPRRFMRNVEETLAESHDCTWKHAAYHLVVTGNCYPQVKEWLVDELSERGHKRWEKAMTTGYENILRLAHENLLPALERFTVLVSRLRGLSRFQDVKAGFGLSTQELDSILDTSSCLQLLAHHTLKIAMSELHQFRAFSAWLHQEIEVQSIDRESDATRETSEGDTTIDYGSTLEYIQGAMNKSRLFNLFNMAEPGEQRSHWDLAVEGRSLYDLYRREFESTSKSDTPEKQLPGLDALIIHLDRQCNAVFSGIAETQRRNVRFGTSVNLGLGVPHRIDMRMLLEDISNPTKFTLYVVTRIEDKADNGKSSTNSLGNGANQTVVLVFKINMIIESGISSLTRVQRACIRTMRAHIQDVKFVDDDNLILAVKTESSSHLLGVRFREAATALDGLSYEDYPERDAHTTDISSSAKIILGFDPLNVRAHDCIQHTFPTGATWTPECIEINGRKGRRAICALAQDRLRYRVYDLDNPLPAEDAHSNSENGDDVVME